MTEKDITIKGKTTSQYLASVVVDNLPPRPFNIRMRRMTPDSTTDQLQNKTLWSSYTEIIDVKQGYPNTALVGVQVDSEQFGSQQVSRNYHLRGRILQVPSNYNPQTRQYSGIWDGTFKPAYSNNMAWCLWDMLNHPRYGMGKRLGAADVDKWALYVIGQNCDQSVPDGFGGTEPRITCNAYLTTQRKAWDVLSDFCSAMRCMPVWNGQTLTFVQDRPSDKVWTYNRSNVVMPDDGAPFRYSFSALKDRHNAVEVNWIDPNNGWETATELVEDTQAIARYGRNVTKMDAFGCTSRGQAHRAGLWLIKTELLETQTVDFSVGAEGLRHVPGDVIEICDDDYAGISTGGRVLAVNSQTRTLTLDREITLPSSGTTLISLVDGSGNPVSVEVQSVTDGVKVKVSRVPDGVAEYSVWGLKLPTLRQRLFRCVSIRENDDGTYAITAVQHVTESHLGKELLEKVELTEDNASRLEQFSKEWKDASDKWNAMWGVKIEQTEDGKHYVAGLGLSMEDTEEGKLSQFLVAANRIAFIDPANGNETPMFVAQGNQIFMNDVFLKRLTAPTITSGGNPPVFSLTPDGKLTAKNADISGNVNANSGTLNNVTINENCTIKGMLEANQVRGDFVKTVSKSFPKKAGTWGSTETPDGTVTVTISDDHNFDRQIIIPPIIFNGIAYDDPGSGDNPGGTRYTGYGFEVRKNGVLIASRETKGAIPGSYSAVIDMPSGRGSVTLEFKIFQKGNQGAGNITDCTVIVTKKAASGISIR